MLDTFGHFILLAVGFGLVIFIHELGHFLAAKAVGIRVDQFAIGFGPALIAWRKGLGLRAGSTTAEYQKRLAAGANDSRLSETEYRFNAFPLGGYVKMLGQEDLDPTATSDDPRSYTAKPVWARMIVISAGVVFNLISAFVLFVGCFMHGVDFTPPIIGAVDPSSPTATARPANAEQLGIVETGLEPGDRILRIDGSDMRKFADILTAAAVAREGEPLTIDVQRGDQDLTFHIKPEESGGLLSLGVFPAQSRQISDMLRPNEVAKLVASLKRVGQFEGSLTPGAIVTRVNGKPVESFHDIESVVHALGADTSLKFEFARPDQPGETIATLTLNATPEWMNDRVEGTVVSHLLGLAPAVQVASVAENSGAENAGIKVGDLIARAGTVQWPRLDQLPGAIARQIRDGAKTVEFVVYRDGTPIRLDVKPNRNQQIGIGMEPAYSTLIINTFPGLEAAALRDAAGDAKEQALPLAEPMAPPIPPGARVVSVNGRSVQTWQDLRWALQQTTDPKAAEPTITLRIALPVPGQPIETVKWNAPREQIERLHRLDWEAPLGFLAYQREVVQAGNPVTAISLGLDETWRMLTMTYLTLDRVIRGSVDAANLKGPVGIAQLGTEVSRQGLSKLVMFLAIISVNLAVLNFLPIPILDGGQFLFLLIEKIKGSPVSPAIQDLATLAGLIIIGGIFLFVTFNDISNLISG